MTQSDPPFTGAEVLAASTVTCIAALIGVAYLTGRTGTEITPTWPTLVAGGIAVAIGRALGRQAQWRRREAGLHASVVIAVLSYLVWMAWPELLPLGSGPDLAHHLMLIDYLERHDHLVQGADAPAHLGEMAHYTPGLHLLAVIAGALTRTDGFHALYSVVALSVALKVGLLLLILWRVLRESSARMPLATCGVLLIAVTPAYSIGSFTQDSFLAQVVSELFAVAMWCAIVLWDQQPTRSAMALFAIAGIATFLTWPVWIGPTVLTLFVLILMRRDRTAALRLAHGAIALGPIALVAMVHVAGRTSWVSIVRTSGAVQQPTPDMLGWCLLGLALLGLTFAERDRYTRALILFAGAILAQAAALFFVAIANGATTPYMAIKMIYIAVYPAIVAAMIALDAMLQRVAAWTRHIGSPQVRVDMIAWAAVGVLIVLAGRNIVMMPKPSLVVSNELWAAGRWARDRLPSHCVDYLVGNEYTAYWLHLSVLGNSRATARTADDMTFLTQPSFARWIGSSGVPYAIANSTILPDEIRRDVDVLQQFGAAAVIARRSGGLCQ